METYDLVLKNGSAVTPAGVVETDVAVKNGKIAAFGSGLSGAETIDCKGLHILPGVIDSQVHFREPGNEHKEDLATGTLSAVAGGVTTIFEMPNTNPLTITADTMQDKMDRAKGRAFCNYAFYMGGAAENAAALAALENLAGVCGVKVFMGSSTGSLLASEDDVIFSILQSGRCRVAIHAEDEARLTERKYIAEKGADVKDHPHWRDAESAIRATKRVLALARKAGRPIHVLHVTTAEEAEILAANKDIATMEVTPQHLTLHAPDCYARMGSRAQMNPPVRTQDHQEALWRAVADGVVDVIGSDHAPHTLDEKAKNYPQSPSGMPGVQTLVPVMLNHVHEGRLSLQRFVDLVCHGPQRIFGIVNKGRLAKGYDADFTIVDLKAERTITDKWIKSKCGWTPFDGMRVTGWPMGTIVHGRTVMWDDEIVESPVGQPVLFYRMCQEKEGYTGAGQDNRLRVTAVQ